MSLLRNLQMSILYKGEKKIVRSVLVKYTYFMCTCNRKLFESRLLSIFV